MKRSIKSTQRLPRLLAFSVTGATGVVGEGATDGAINAFGTGSWTITFTVPFLRTPMISVSSISAANVLLSVSAVSVTAVTVKGMLCTDGVTATNTNFNLTALGFDTADKT